MAKPRREHSAPTHSYTTHAADIPTASVHACLPPATHACYVATRSDPAPRWRHYSSTSSSSGMCPARWVGGRSHTTTLISQSQWNACANTGEPIERRVGQMSRKSFVDFCENAGNRSWVVNAPALSCPVLAGGSLHSSVDSHALYPPHIYYQYTIQIR